MKRVIVSFEEEMIDKEYLMPTKAETKEKFKCEACGNNVFERVSSVQIKCTACGANYQHD